MNTVPKTAQQYSKRLLPRLLDEFAQSTPNRTFATISITQTGLESLLLQDITFSEVANCVNFFANWLEKSLGRGASFETLCYIGIPDLRYAVVFLGAIKCGYKTLFISSRNPFDTNISLLEQTECSKLCYSAEVATLAEAIVDVRRMSCLEVSSLEEMIQAETVPYVYDEVFENVSANPIVVFHSSGTTGPPKPIIISHAAFATLENDRNLPEIPGRRKHDFTIWNFPGGAKFYSAFPPVHLVGFIASTVIPLYAEMAVPVLGPPLKPPCASILREILTQRDQNIRALFMPPSIAEQLLEDPDAISLFEKIEFVFFTGGQLPTAVGDRLCQITNLSQFYGSTETFQIQQMLPEPEDWAYVEWHPNCNVNMQVHEAENETYELVISADSSTAVHHIYPDIKEYRMGDLFKRHPTKPSLWKVIGRANNIIVMSNGLKVNPIPMEMILQEDAAVAGSIVIGQGRAQAALIIEPREPFDNSRKDEFIDKVWPTIERANSKAAAYGQITPSKLIIGTKPFIRSAKGTVLRHPTIVMYQQDIDAIYSSDEVPTFGSIILSTKTSLEDVKRFVQTRIHALLHAELSPGDDFFAAGLDSLRLIELSQELQHGASLGGLGKLPRDIIWKNPTIGGLSQAVYSAIHASQDHVAGNISSPAVISAMIEKYTSDFCSTKGSAPASISTNVSRVILTGATGSIGVYVLQGLLKDPRISKVYCLDRSPSAKMRIEKTLEARHEKFDFLDSSRVEFLKVDLAKKQFGLQQAKFNELAEHVDCILHCAWRVDFNLVLGSFEPLICGLRALVDFSIAASRHPRIVFFSSIASAQNFGAIKGLDQAVPESIINSEQVAIGLGYGESKYVAERILSVASARYGIPVTVLRIGQVAGPVNGFGAWPQQEWVPSLIQTSKTISLLPTAGFEVNWIPIDTLAKIVLEIALAESKDTLITVYNLVNPLSTKWNDCLKPIQDALGKEVGLCPLSEWVSQLEELDATNLSNRRSMPALNMLGFFQRLKVEGTFSQHFETKEASRASKTLAELAPIHDKWIKLWMQQLRDAGSLQ